VCEPHTYYKRTNPALIRDARVYVNTLFEEHFDDTLDGHVEIGACGGFLNSQLGKKNIGRVARVL